MDKGTVRIAFLMAVLIVLTVFVIHSCVVKARNVYENTDVRGLVVQVGKEVKSIKEEINEDKADDNK